MSSNAPQERNALTAPAPDALSVLDQLDAASLILGPAFERVKLFSDLMASGTVTVPRHLQGKPGDCMAVVLQALSRRMDPFAFAQKTHVTKGGILGYEGQLISAMLSPHLEIEPEYEWLGEWDRILGRVIEKKGESGGTYYARDWPDSDEAGLGVVCRATLKGERKPRELRVMLSQCWPRFSTQWATDPRQQICNLAVKKWGRLYKPAALLGVQDMEDAEAISNGEPRFMGAAEVVEAEPRPPAPPPAPATYDAAAFEKNFPTWADLIRRGRKTAADIIATAETRAPLTQEQRDKVLAVKVDAPAPTQQGATQTPAQAPAQAPAAEAPARGNEPPAGRTDVQDVAPKVTYAQVADKLAKAKTRDQLADAGTLIGAVNDPVQRTELVRLYNERNDEIPF